MWKPKLNRWLVLALLVGATALADGQTELAERAAELGLSPDALSKLSGDQLFTLLNEPSSPPEAVVIPTVFFLFMFGALAAGLYASFRKERIRHETLQAIIQKGGAIPSELLVPSRRTADLRRGVTLFGAGLGLSIFLAALPDTPARVWTGGLILMLLGAGYLVTWKLQSTDAK
jgi:hypothetical protein